METTTTKIARYEIISELGRGGMGVVYLAKDPLIGRVVAVKTIRLSTQGSGISHEELVERFQTEARAAGRLTHPNIVVVYDAGEENGLYYITMELIDGRSLQSILDEGHKLTVQRSLAIIEQVCSGLAFAHSSGIVHRDIKPANIMLMRQDAVKITDFGTAKILQYGTQQKTNAVGTPSYMSPEQVKGKAIDGRSDIFSVGVMLYEMTTGQKPFKGHDVASVLYKILNEQPPAPHELDPNILPGVSSAIMKALSKGPHMRYDSCGEFLDDLQNYRPGGFSGKPKPASASPQGEAAPPPAPRNPNSLKAEMPRIPGVASRPAVEPAKAPAAQTPKPKPAKADTAATDVASAAAQIPGLYQGSVKKPFDLSFLKTGIRVAVALLIVAVIARFAVNRIGSSIQPDSAQEQRTPAPREPAHQEETVAPEDSGAPRASMTNPEIAKISELAAPWSSKKFFFLSPTKSKYVPALIVRLPGPAANRNSYWAFSLNSPFGDCKLEYLTDLQKIAEFGVRARHPMVVNPCTQSVFDPLQMKEMPGDFLVRGAILQGYDARPPFGIEVEISGNRILATNME